jgi:ribosomal protein S18 acetylase RimI-like enzyme
MVEGLNSAFDALLLSRIEDASLNASAPRQQLWMDGWLVRFSPGKARRARSINAVAAGRLPLADKLEACAAVFRDAGLPVVVRITPFSQPPTLDAELAARGWGTEGETTVKLLADLAAAPSPPLPPGIAVEYLAATEYAGLVGRWRGSDPQAVAAHDERLRSSPVPYEGYVLKQRGRPLACGQFAREGDLVGLYDVFTAEAARGHGLARLLCTQLLQRARGQGARTAYLQVESDNGPARALYRRLGFVEAYGYRYRTPPAA